VEVNRLFRHAAEPAKDEYIDTPFEDLGKIQWHLQLQQDN
jgi:hypothetical protein